MAKTRRRRRRPLPTASKVVGVGCAGAMMHGFPNREHRQKEEGKTSSFPPFSQPGNTTNAVADGGAIAGRVGARGEGPRDHQKVQEMNEERAEEMASSPAWRMEVEVARFDVMVRSGTGGRFFAC